MRQHVNPLSKFFNSPDPIPPLNKIFNNPSLPVHLDIGCGNGDFLFQLAKENSNWNYLGIEIREKLVIKAKRKLKKQDINNLYFSYGNANNILEQCLKKFPKEFLNSISLNFPDPWFKKKHHKRRILQPQFLAIISDLMIMGSLVSIKSDVKELFVFMENTILNSSNFKKLNIEELEFANTFNPSKIKTEREKHAKLNNLCIYENFYKKIKL